MAKKTALNENNYSVKEHFSSVKSQLLFSLSWDFDALHDLEIYYIPDKVYVKMED